MTTYSFGEDSPVKFEISDKMAKNYNNAVEKWLKAHQRFNQKFGKKWDPESDPIVVRWSNRERKAWNSIADMFNRKTGGYDHPAGPFHPTDFADDFLVKNVVSAVAGASSNWGRIISLSVLGAVVYELLRGR